MDITDSNNLEFRYSQSFKGVMVFVTILCLGLIIVFAYQSFFYQSTIESKPYIPGVILMLFFVVAFIYQLSVLMRLQETIILSDVGLANKRFNGTIILLRWDEISQFENRVVAKRLDIYSSNPNKIIRIEHQINDFPSLIVRIQEKLEHSGNLVGKDLETLFPNTFHQLQLEQLTDVQIIENVNLERQGQLLRARKGIYLSVVFVFIGFPFMFLPSYEIINFFGWISVYLGIWTFLASVLLWTKWSQKFDVMWLRKIRERNQNMTNIKFILRQILVGAVILLTFWIAVKSFFLGMDFFLN